MADSIHEAIVELRSVRWPGSSDVLRLLSHDARLPTVLGGGRTAQPLDPEEVGRHFRQVRIDSSLAAQARAAFLQPTALAGGLANPRGTESAGTEGASVTVAGELSENAAVEAEPSLDHPLSGVWPIAAFCRSTIPGAAASQLNWLIMAAPLNQAMLPGDAAIPRPAQLRAHAVQAVRVFLAAYGKE